MLTASPSLIQVRAAKQKLNNVQTSSHLIPEAQRDATEKVCTTPPALAQEAT